MTTLGTLKKNQKLTARLNGEGARLSKCTGTVTQVEERRNACMKTDKVGDCSWYPTFDDYAPTPRFAVQVTAVPLSIFPKSTRGAASGWPAGLTLLKKSQQCQIFSI